MATEALESKKAFDPRGWLDRYPHYFLLTLIGLVGLFGMPLSTWVTMTVAGLAMGLMIFIMASGMTLTFGLMGVLNLGHGAFITVGAFAGAATLLALYEQGGAGWYNLAMILPALVVAVLVAGVLGLIFERLIIRPVYNDHLKQILVTVGGAIVIVEALVLIMGPNEIPLPRPEVLRGAFVFGEVVIERYRLLAVVVGLLIFWGMLALINKTKVGLLIRAGVENLEMVEALGYRIRLLFISVFVAGSALAAVGGVMWGLYEELIHVHMGELRLVQVIIVIIIGGLGSVTGCFYGALAVGLLANYVGFMLPGFAEFASIGLMVAVLMWRPQGLIPIIKV